MTHRLAGLLIACLLALAPAMARAQAYSLGVSAGTQGFGGEAGVDIGDAFAVRAAGNYFAISHGVSGEQVDYNGHLRLLTVGGMVDYYLFQTNFHLTGGAYLNRNRIDLNATPTSSVRIGNTTYTPAQAGHITGRVWYRDVAPYAGVGYSGNRGETGLAFVFDAGVMFSGGARVALASDSPLASTVAFSADLANERDKINNDVDILEYYPVVRAGLAYRF